MKKNPWKKVVFATDLPACEWCGEPYCSKHKKHYADCSCLGPTQDGAQYKTVRGTLYGRKISSKK